MKPPGADCRRGSAPPRADGEWVSPWGGIQTPTAVSHLCLIRDRINCGYGITRVSYDACKDIGILQLKETLS